MINRTIRTLVRTLYDFQDLRIRLANRLKKKKDGSDQKNVDDIDIIAEAMPTLLGAWKRAQESENDIEFLLEQELKVIPIYTEFLNKVKGIGPRMSGVIIGEYDIHIADTASKLWQFTGLNPGMVYGRKVDKSKTGPNGKALIYRTTDLIRGDKRTVGYLSPYNGWLRTKMIGALAPALLKSRTPSVYVKFYYDVKTRLENSMLIYERTGKLWKDEPKGHRDLAARRYMVKMFLADLYKEWRFLEGLTVRPPYKDEYLGKIHQEDLDISVVDDFEDMQKIVDANEKLVGELKDAED